MSRPGPRLRERVSYQGVEFPRVLIYETDGDELGASRELGVQLQGLGVEAPFVVSSPHGLNLATSLRGVLPPLTPPPTADQHWSADLGSRIRRSGADAVVAVGGGRVLDVAKLAAARAGRTLVAVPTQLSHDGICSPVAVVPNEQGRAESLGAIVPRLVYLSLPTLLATPATSVRAGIGDLIANPFALKDWSHAASRGLAELDERAWDLSVESHEVITPLLDIDPEVVVKDPDHLRRLADGLVLSGLAMICSGNSRPASGAEHEVSHSLDQLFGGPAMHGAQVAFGCIFSAALYEEDVSAFRARLRRLGLPSEPADLGLGTEEVVRVLLAAPDTRPGRFTILEDADLDEGSARSLVEGVFGRG